MKGQLTTLPFSLTVFFAVGYLDNANQLHFLKLGSNLFHQI